MECLLCSISHPYLFIALFSTLFLILWSIIKPIWSMDTLNIPNSLWTNGLKAKPARKNVKNSVTVQTLKEIFSYSIVIQRSNIQNLTIFKTFKIFKNAQNYTSRKNAIVRCVIRILKKTDLFKQYASVVLQHSSGNDLETVRLQHLTQLTNPAWLLWICYRWEFQIDQLILWNVYLIVMTNRRSLLRYLVSSHRN